LKVVITAASLGTRLLPASKEIPKEMFPVFAIYGGEVVVKPLLQIIFESFYDAGFREFCFVVGRGKRAIEDHFTPDWSFVEWLRSRGRERLAKLLEDFYRRVEGSHIVWVNQHEPLGFGHAVLMAEPFIDGDFMVAAGDTVLPSSSFTGDMASMGSEMVLIVKKVEDPRRYGVAVLQGDRVVRVVEKPIAEAAYEVNRERPRKALELLKKHLGSLRGRRIGVLGLSFKPDTDDIRESRGIEVAKLLIEEGAEVYVSDPAAIHNAKKILGERVTYIEDPQKLLESVEAVVIATEWPQYQKLDYRGKIVVDGRRIEKAREAKIYEGMTW
jgi:choline kinase